MNTTLDASLGRMAALAAATAAAAALGGCAASHGGQPGGAGPSAGEPASGPFYGHALTTGGSATGSTTRHSGEGAMCAMHRDMENAPDEAARRAIEERRLQGMSPGQRRQHMDMMRRQCP